MTTTVKATLLDRMRGVILRGHGQDASDADLLTAYLADRAEHAFRAIVRRHGAMVLGVCRRAAGDVHDADDAFQATFLVLVRKAASIVPRDNLAGWLHGVAYRTALKAKSMKARRFAKEQRAAAATASKAVADESEPAHGPELRVILDRELAALPDCFRLPVVLCDLEGKSRKEAARQLGCGEGTLSGRLARGRRRLAQRLVRQGITLGAGGVAACLSQQALAVVPAAPLVSATVKAGMLFSAGDLGGASASVADLVGEVLQAMFMSKLKAAASGLAVLVVGLGLAAATYGGLAADEQDGARFFQARQPKRAAGEAPLAGKIYVHRGKDPAVFDARGKGFSELPPLSDEVQRRNYQPQHTRLSPDGRYLAIGCIEPNTGTPPQRLHIREVGKDEAPTEIVSMPGKELSNWLWSPDGKKLTFAVWDEGDGQYHPWIVDVATKKTERIKLPDLPGKVEKDYGALIHAWTTDGLWVVFSKGHFHLMNPATKETRKLNEQPTGFRQGSVRVSPDGKRMLYCGYSKDREGKWAASLRVIDFLMGKMTIAADLGNKADVSAAWSPDSRQIVVSHADADGEGRAAGGFRVQVLSIEPGAQPRTLMTADEWLTVTDWR